MNYQHILQFKGTWRNYQARVLDNIGQYITDGKIHIVAAPGSGKTTLGIELIARMGEVALILTPSITIRQQWADRIAEGFLCDGLSPDDYISQDLKNPRCITIATYQALHSAMSKYRGVLDESGTTERSFVSDDRLEKSREEETAVDYSDFDVITEMKQANVGVLCLDECHHLRSEWWNALEDFRQGLDNVKMIALTATPPYDSTPAMWKRYMDMCGEIDEEISIPELVKEGSLCPHQDFVCFNYPTDEEMQEIEQFKNRSLLMQEQLCQDEAFLGQLRTHRGLNGSMTQQELLEEGEYLSALLIYLQARGETIPDHLQQILGKRKLPELSTEWLECLVQGFLYQDADSYETTKEYRDLLTDELKGQGLIEKKKVCFRASESIEKLLTNSKGKCSSIRRIAEREYQSMGAGLRMLILTDYIRKEYEKHIGDIQSNVTALGVLPFFEQLRRACEESSSLEGMRLGVLCGTIVIIPAEAKEALLAQVKKPEKVSFSPVGSLNQTDYFKVTAAGGHQDLTQAVTEIFTKGYMQVLIGTKSLLGEGWDSPCINSLILASFVGSFMLSNQMRGRAIRTFAKQPDKNSNIWHLVCLMPQKEGGSSDGAAAEEEVSEDFELLKRRMEHFPGLHYTENVIETGMERMSVIQPPFDRTHTESINEQMMQLSAQRASLKERWNQALQTSGKMEIVNAAEVDDAAVSKTIYQKNKKQLIAAGAGAAAGIALTFTPFGWLGGVVAAGAGIYGATRLAKTAKANTTQKRVKTIAEEIYLAMVKKNLLKGQSVVMADEDKKGKQTVYLTHADAKDKLLFAGTIREFFSAVNDQRYLLVKGKNQEDCNRFYCVPECFAKKKEDAEFFYSYVRPYIGDYELVYTRSESGRALLLEGRLKSLSEQGTRSRTYQVTVHSQA